MLTGEPNNITPTAALTYSTVLALGTWLYKLLMLLYSKSVVSSCHLNLECILSLAPQMANAMTRGEVVGGERPQSAKRSSDRDFFRSLSPRWLFDGQEPKKIVIEKLNKLD